MALTFRTNDALASGSPYTFSAIAIGEEAADRRVLVGVAVYGTNESPTITIGGIAASKVNEEVRSTNTQCLFIATVPTGTTADVVVTRAGSTSVSIGVWTATGMTSSTPIEAHDDTLLNSGTDHSDYTIATADGGFVIATSVRSSGTPNWTGVTQQFVSGGWSGAHKAPTTGTSLYVKSNSITNINSGWTLTSFASGGEPDEGGEGGGGGEEPGEIPGDGGTPTPGAGDRITDSNAVFFRLDTDPPLRLWCGINDIPIEMVNVDADGAVYLGAGRLLNVPDLEVLINGVADRVEFYLPGVSVENSNRVASGAPDIQGTPVHVGLATLDDRYQPITAITPVWYGLADLWAMKQPQSADPAQPPARTLVLSVGAGRTGRARARRAAYTDAQQKLLYPTDRFCDRVARYTQLYDVEWPIF